MNVVIHHHALYSYIYLNMKAACMQATMHLFLPEHYCQYHAVLDVLCTAPGLLIAISKQCRQQAAGEGVMHVPAAD